MSLVHIIEFLGIIFGGTVALLRFWPQLRQLAIGVQVMFFIIQIFGVYLKMNPQKKYHLKYFVHQIIDHYFQTHPEGQMLAKTTDYDEKAQEFIHEEQFVKKDPHQVIYRVLGIKVDNK